MHSTAVFCLVAHSQKCFVPELNFKWSFDFEVKPRIMNAISFNEKDLDEIFGISNWESDGGSTDEGEK